MKPKHFLSCVLLSILLSANGLAGSADEKVLHVFLLVGQSNMEGKGNPVHLDTYKADPAISPTYASLKDGDGWAVRDDVWITYPSKARGAKHGKLSVGYGTKGVDSIGPEFGFGHTIGNAIDGPVLIIKTAWGGKSLAVDFRPPSKPPTDEEVDELLKRLQRKKPETTVEDARAKYGFYYREMMRHIHEELTGIGDKFPELADLEPKFSGFVWHQGFNDKVNGNLRKTKYADYGIWLEAFIRDVRKDLGAEKLPFVIGELSTGGIPSRGDFQKAQAAAAEPDDFQGNVSFVLTAEFYDMAAQKLYEANYWKGTDEQKAEWEKVGNDRPYHYLGSGKTYYLKGVAFGKSMLEMLADEN